MNAGLQEVASIETQNGNFRLETIADSAQTYRVLSINGHVIATTKSDSESILAEQMLAGIGEDQGYAEVLIGGLGLGITLRHVLQHKAVQSVCVVEIEPQIIEWNRTHLANADVLDDARVEVVIGDFCSYVQGVPRNYHGIAMHIGSDQVMRAANRQAYSLSMLQVLHTRLRSGGALAICTSEINASYERALLGIFNTVEIFLTNDTNRSCTIYQVMA